VLCKDQPIAASTQTQLSVRGKTENCSLHPQTKFKSENPKKSIFESTNSCQPARWLANITVMGVGLKPFEPEGSTLHRGKVRWGGLVVLTMHRCSLASPLEGGLGSNFTESDMIVAFAPFYLARSISYK